MKQGVVWDLQDVQVVILVAFSSWIARMSIELFSRINFTFSIEFLYRAGPLFQVPIFSVFLMLPLAVCAALFCAFFDGFFFFFGFVG